MYRSVWFLLFCVGKWHYRSIWCDSGWIVGVGHIWQLSCLQAGLVLFSKFSWLHHSLLSFLRIRSEGAKTKVLSDAMFGKNWILATTTATKTTQTQWYLRSQQNKHCPTCFLDRRHHKGWTKSRFSGSNVATIAMHVAHACFDQNTHVRWWQNISYAICL